MQKIQLEKSLSEGFIFYAISTLTIAIQFLFYLIHSPRLAMMELVKTVHTAVYVSKYIE